jgi:ribosomal protein L23
MKIRFIFLCFCREKDLIAQMSLPNASLLYFPNICFRMMRSHHPPHIAVFRVPNQLNKIDIKNYLTSLYDVKVASVRTAVYLGKKINKPIRGQLQSTRSPSYKKAIVTMEEDFQFPAPNFKDAVTMNAPEGQQVHGKV